MSNYRRDYHEAEGHYFWTLPRACVAAVFGLIALGTVGFFVNLAMQPGRVLTKTFDADNMIGNYEWFHDVNGNFLAKTAQVRQFKQLASAETDAGERSRLRIDQTAIQQSCRDLARRYNANAEKMNRGIFRSHSLPETLNAGECE